VWPISIRGHFSQAVLARPLDRRAADYWRLPEPRADGRVSFARGPELHQFARYIARIRQSFKGISNDSEGILGIRESTFPVPSLIVPCFDLPQIVQFCRQPPDPLVLTGKVGAPKTQNSLYFSLLAGKWFGE